MLSYDRYSTLTVYHKRGPNYRRPLLAVGGIWLYSLFWTVPPLLGWSSYGLEGAGTSCSVSWTLRTTASHSYIICLFIFCLGLPVLIMVYCYSRLLHAVKQVSLYVCVCVCVCLCLGSSLLIQSTGSQSEFAGNTVNTVRDFSTAQYLWTKCLARTSIVNQ